MSEKRRQEMKIREALMDTGLAEASYNSYTAFVTKMDGGYKFTIQHGNKPPKFTCSDISLDKLEEQISSIGVKRPLDWNPVELEG